ncbi:hypothetical protein G6F56_002984 [Rhizopus delemar]|nr:hypothetical protein G6F56_002984 [Rhizopus delemar]
MCINKRELIIVDESEKSVRLTLWNKIAQDFDSSNHPIVACRYLRVSEFNGKSLSLATRGILKINPDIPEVNALSRWYTESRQSILNLGSLSNLKTENLGGNGQCSYFSFKGTVVYINQEKLAYAGCSRCKKKLIQEKNEWRCGKCRKLYTRPDWQYVLTLGIADSTSQLLFNAFDGVGNHIMNTSATKLIEMKRRDIPGFHRVCKSALFKTYNMKARAKACIYNSQRRMEYLIMEATRINFIKESQELVSHIENLMD